LLPQNRHRDWHQAPRREGRLAARDRLGHVERELP
jgi:hypothetical protein